MNISGIDATPCSLMDEYDNAMRELHVAILTKQSRETIAALQGKTIVVRNKIAEKMVRLSWAEVPEEDRR